MTQQKSREKNQTERDAEIAADLLRKHGRLIKGGKNA